MTSTWWAGISSIVLGVFAIFRPDYGPATEFGRVLSMLLGGSDSSPAGLIVMGAGLIGIRDKLERDSKLATKQRDTA